MAQQQLPVQPQTIYERWADETYRARGDQPYEISVVCALREIFSGLSWEDCNGRKVRDRPGVVVCHAIRQLWASLDCSVPDMTDFITKYKFDARPMFDALEMDSVINDAGGLLENLRVLTKAIECTLPTTPVSTIPIAAEIWTPVKNLFQAPHGVGVLSPVDQQRRPRQRVVVEICQATALHHLAKKCLQLEKDLAYYVVKDSALAEPPVEQVNLFDTVAYVLLVFPNDGEAVTSLVNIINGNPRVLKLLRIYASHNRFGLLIHQHPYVTLNQMQGAMTQMQGEMNQMHGTMTQMQGEMNQMYEAMNQMQGTLNAILAHLNRPNIFVRGWRRFRSFVSEL
jgi:hypothetical protein